jgi:two-component system, cell cycle response regulator
MKNMKKKLLKALVVLDEQEDSWFLNGGFHEAIDFHLLDVKALPVKMHDFPWTLREIEAQAPDVLLMDSTMSSHFVLRLAVHVRDKIPTLPIFLLPAIHDAVNEAERALLAADTIARTIRYAHGRLGLQRTLLQMALRDDLTGLHNRRGFMAIATQHMTWARDTGQHMLMFFADVDGLKSINDRFGHAEGDRAISLAAACIKRTFRRFDVTARLSGDEFVALIMEDPGRSADIIRRRLRMNLARCTGTETRYGLSLSIGVAHFDPDQPVTLQELMRQADAELYQHKRMKDSSVSGGAAADADAEAPGRAAGGAHRSTLGASATAAASNIHRLSEADRVESIRQPRLARSGPLIESTVPRG